MEKLTPAERQNITLEEINKNPVETICAMAAVKMAEIAIASTTTNYAATTSAQIDGKNYKITLTATLEEVK